MKSPMFLGSISWIPWKSVCFWVIPPRDPTLHRLLHQPRGELRPEQLGAGAWTRQGQDAGGGQIQAWDQLQPAWRGNVETYGERNMEKPWKDHGTWCFFVFFCVFMLLIPFLCVCGWGLWYLRINCKQEVNGKPSSCLIFGWATNLGVVSEKRWWFYSQILAVHSYKIWVSGEPFQKHPRTSFEGLNEPMGLG